MGEAKKDLNKKWGMKQCGWLFSIVEEEVGSTNVIICIFDLLSQGSSYGEGWDIKITYHFDFIQNHHFSIRLTSVEEK